MIRVKGQIFLNVFLVDIRGPAQASLIFIGTLCVKLVPHATLLHYFCIKKNHKKIYTITSTEKTNLVYMNMHIRPLTPLKARAPTRVVRCNPFL